MRWFWLTETSSAMQLLVTPKGNAVLFHWTNHANQPHNEKESAGMTEKSCMDWLTKMHWSNHEKSYPPPWVAKKLDTGCEITGQVKVIGEL